MSPSDDKINLQVHCHCKAFTHTLPIPCSSLPLSAPLCHCTRCRHTFGHLFSSYIEILGGGSKIPSSDPVTNLPHDLLLKANAIECQFAANSRHWFCGKCGASLVLEYDGGKGWLLASGLIENWKGVKLERVSEFLGEESTGDGGAGVWFKGLGEKMGLRIATAESEVMTWDALEKLATNARTTIRNLDLAKQEQRLPFHCACGSIKGHITRPSPPPQRQQNNCFYLNSTHTEYIACMCDCTSCRLTSGFEYTAWVHVPLENIFFFSTSSSSNHGPQSANLSNLPNPLLQYNSSKGKTRHFCHHCGCNILYTWEGRTCLPSRPVSMNVGIFESRMEARGEDWFEWHAQKGPAPDATDGVVAKGLWEGTKEWEEGYK